MCIRDRGGVVDAVGVDAGVDPAAPSGGAVRLHRGEVGQQVSTLIVVLTGQVPSVDLAQNRIGRRLVAAVDAVVPREVKDWTVPLLGGYGQALADLLAERVEEVQLAAGVARRFDRLVVPLKHPLGLGERAVLLDMGSRREEEELGADVLRAQLSGGDLRAVLPERRGLDEVEVAHDQPLEVRHTKPCLLYTSDAADEE